MATIASSTVARMAALLLGSLALAACLGNEDSRSISYTDDRGIASQPFPANYRSEILAVMRTYLNNPVGVRDAEMAEPVQRVVGGRLRYVSCLKYSARDFDGNYRQPRESGVLYVDGRLDRILDRPGDACAGAVYLPFPELQGLTR